MFGIALPVLIGGAKKLLETTGVGKKIGGFIGGLFGKNKSSMKSQSSKPVYTVPIGLPSSQGIATTAQTNKKKDKIGGGSGNVQQKIDKIGNGGLSTKDKLDKMDDDANSSIDEMNQHIKGIDNKVLYGAGAVLAGLIVYLATKK